MNATFQIEQILLVNDKVYVCVKHINTDIDFNLSDFSALSGATIENWMDLPRAFDSKGNFRNNHYVFALKDAQDQSKIKVGDIVELNNGE